ncbi:MAG TPA: sigma-70 family RNA polymerase sigma factor [Bacteroidales bacterium]|nr:sigma-70 family RNA polymerase sigma factor [Bacteroidales bacterium]
MTSKSDYTDFELVFQMSYRDDAEFIEEGRKAFGILYQRHYPFLYVVVMKSMRNFPNSEQKKETARDVVSNVFKMFYDKAPTIVRALEKHRDVATKHQTQVFRAYLATMAKRELFEYLDYQNHHIHTDDRNVDFFEDALSEVDFFDEAEHQMGDQLFKHPKIIEAWNTLDEREQDILYSTLDYKIRNIHVPDFIMRALCLRYQIEQGHVRTIRHRAIEKLKRILQPHAQLFERQ